MSVTNNIVHWGKAYFSSGQRTKNKFHCDRENHSSLIVANNIFHRGKEHCSLWLTIFPPYGKKTEIMIARLLASLTLLLLLSLRLLGDSINSIHLQHISTFHFPITFFCLVTTISRVITVIFNIHINSQLRCPCCVRQEGGWALHCWTGKWSAIRVIIIVTKIILIRRINGTNNDDADDDDDDDNNDDLNVQGSRRTHCWWPYHLHHLCRRTQGEHSLPSQQWILAVSLFNLIE